MVLKPNKKRVAGSLSPAKTLVNFRNTTMHLKVGYNNQTFASDSRSPSGLAVSPAFPTTEVPSNSGVYGQFSVQKDTIVSSDSKSCCVSDSYTCHETILDKIVTVFRPSQGDKIQQQVVSTTSTKKRARRYKHLYTSYSMTTDYLEDNSNGLISFNPQSGKFRNLEKIEGVPQITQRVIVPTAYRKPTNSKPFRRIRKYKPKAPDVKPEPIRVRASEADVLFPQMNFMSPITLKLDDAASYTIDSFTDKLKEGIEVKHSLDPEVTNLLKEVTDIFSGKGKPFTVDVQFPYASMTKVTMFALILGTGLYHLHKRDSDSIIIFGGMLSVGVLTQSFLTLPGFTDLMSVMTGSSNKPWYKEVINQMFSFQKNFDSVSACVRAILTVIESIINYIARDLLGGKSICLLGSGNVIVDEFLADVRQVCDDIYHDKFTATKENAFKVHEMWLKSQEIIKSIPKGSDSGLVLSLSNASNYLLSVKKTFDGLNLRMEGNRIEPTTALFLGAPGVGKSNMMYPLAFELIARTINMEKLPEFEKSPHSFIYNRMAEAVYWEGYTTDKIVCFIDDLGQLRDVAGNPDNEWMNFIRMCSAFDYCLHMASIEKKGNMHFQSRFVIANSNLPHFNIESIVEPEAFERRVDFCFVVCPKLQYCVEESSSAGIWSRRLDKSKLGIGVLGITELTPEICEFHEMKLHKGKTESTGRILQYHELADAMVDLAKIKERRNQQQDMMLKDIITKAVNRRQEEPELTMEPMEPQMHFDTSSYPGKNPEKWEEFLGHPDPTQRCQLLVFTYHEIHGSWPHCQAAFDYFVHILGDRFIESSDDLEKLEIFFKTIIAEEPALFTPHILGVKVPKALLNFMEFWKGWKADMQEAISRCSNVYLEWWHEIKKVMKIMIPTILLAFSIEIIGRVIIDVFKRMWRATTGMFETESYSGKPQRERNRGGTRSLNSRNFKERFTTNAKSASMQSAQKYDQANVDITSKIMKRNCYEMWLPDQDWKIGHITFVRGRVFMVPKHFLTKIYYILEEHPHYDNKLVTFKKAGSSIEFQLKMIDLMNTVEATDLETLDCCLVVAPKHIPNHCDITEYFLDQEMVGKIKECEFRLVLPGVSSFESWMGMAKRIDSELVSGEESYILTKGFKYKALTKDGDCGGLFTIVSPNSGKAKVGGMHVAGSSSLGVGMASLITREDLEEALKLTDEIIEKYESDMVPQSSEVLIDGRFEDRYEAEFRYSSGGRSNVIRSPLYGCWGPARKQPALLNPTEIDGVLVDPMVKAVTKLGHPTPFVEPSIARDIRKMVFSHVIHVSPFKVEKRIYTTKEAIVGLADDPDFGSLSRTTSMGYPDCARPGRKQKGKLDIFGSGQEYDLSSPQAIKFMEECEIIENAARMGCRMEHIYADTLKDELRPIEKARSGSTRLFSSCPARLVVLFRKYFGAFTLWCHKNRIYNHFAVGVNPYSVEWEMIAQNLLRFGPSTYANMGAGDYSSYDTREISLFQREILEGINAWYSDEHSRVREVLFLEITNSVHINGTHVYSVNIGNPSGNPLTTLVNNFYNLFLMSYTYYKKHDFILPELYGFFKNVYPIVLGDDHVFAVAHHKTDVFNELSMQECVADLGMIYTNEFKGALGVKLRTINEISFLKRSFRIEPYYTRYAAPLDLFTILEIPYWTKRSLEKHQIVKDNVDIALRELSLHPPEVYQAFAHKIVSASSDKIDYVPPVTDRTALLAIVADCKDWY